MSLLTDNAFPEGKVRIDFAQSMHTFYNVQTGIQERLIRARGMSHFYIPEDAQRKKKKKKVLNVNFKKNETKPKPPTN